MIWLEKNADASAAASLAEALRSTVEPAVASALARLLVNRGITEPEAAQRFLAPSLSQLHSPYLMLGMQAAVERLEAAIARQETVLIYGDYDVDGTTAIVVLKTAIEMCGGTADFHVPHRIRDGYGMKDDVIESAAAAGVRLIISVDTGIRAFAAAETARRVGVDLIVTDHHLPGAEGVPKALAVLNPNQAGCDYPCKDLCGCGVAFKLAQALMARRLPDKEPSRLLTSFLKVVAIATIADAVPLAGENRVFARLGLAALRNPVNLGLRALFEVAEVGRRRGVTAGEVGFRIAPRMNAAGRMDVARDVIDLFAVKDAAQAREIAGRLDKLNADRQEEERRILEEIHARFEREPALGEAFCIVIDGDGWHRGVIGITATRVVEKYGRPTLVISRDGEQAHGSGRSIHAFHLLNAIESCGELFSRFGGHAHAVGFALPSAQVEALRARLETYARARLTAADFEPVLRVESELSLSQVTPALLDALKRMEPFGMGNPEPVFTAAGVQLVAPPKLIQDKHVRLKLAAGVRFAAQCHSDASGEKKRSWTDSIVHNAMGWRKAELITPMQLLPGDALDVAFTVGENDHPQYGGLELTLCDVRRAEQGAAVPLNSEKPAVKATA